MSPIRIYRPSFPLNLRFLTLSDNRGMRVTIRTDKITVYTIRATGDCINECNIGREEYLTAMIKEITAIALAGVGSPLNETVWVESVLNFARRSAAQTGIITGA